MRNEKLAILKFLSLFLGVFFSVSAECRRDQIIRVEGEKARERERETKGSPVFFNFFNREERTSLFVFFFIFFKERRGQIWYFRNLKVRFKGIFSHAHS